MNNFIQPGDSLDLVAPGGGVVSGNGYQIGSLFVVAAVTADAGANFVGATRGVYSLAKTSAQAWTVGQKIYWDAGNSRCDSNGTVGMLIGVCVSAAANPSSTGIVRLNGAAPATAEGPQAAVADVAEADADATYGQAEADLINEIKAQFNTLLARQRDAGIIAP